MLFLLDTNAFSDLMNAHPLVTARLAALAPGDRASICTIVRGEVRYGIELVPSGRRRRDLEAKAAALFSNIPCDPVPVAAADAYARIKLESRRGGFALNENDLWMAATASALGAALVTRDADFQPVRGLLLRDWTR